jgi:hypothetical protein
MKLKVSRADLWTATIDDRAGGAADKLEPLAKAGTDFEFVFARRMPEQPGKGILFVTPVKGAKITKAAQETGFAKPDYMHSVRIEGANKPGTTAKIARAMAGAGLSFRALSATAVGRSFVSFVVLDNAADVASAVGVLKKLS